MLPVGEPSLLFVEDNQANATLYLRMLAQLGYHKVQWCQAGIEGLKAALAHPFGLYLIDLDLPDLDGLQVGLSLRRHMTAARLKHAPLVALTARTDTATRDEAEHLGFSAWLCKPCTQEDLSRTLRAVWEKRA
ncbi:MAG: response regulator [Anaerolineae bacterium]|nr:response regulator [Anaerolineae bacterium]